ncbi:MAG: inorganic phosphate transporter [Clostridiales bacterium]|nr:inorganic phosphate transporter [Clostridiales bacterium]
MTVSFGGFVSQTISNPALLVTVLLTLGVIFVNGWTDAPNAIATCVSTRSMKARSAIAMAAVANFLGVFIMTELNSTVAQTIFNMVSFGGSTEKAAVALSSAMGAIVIWAVAAWSFGIPTSESHALIAGLSGAAICVNGGLSGINFAEWGKVLAGLLLSTLMGFVMGYVTAKTTGSLFKNFSRQKTAAAFKKAQIFGGGAMAFMHGAQDGQKFMGVFMLGIFLSGGKSSEQFVVPFWLILLCSVTMSLGTSVGGYRIIRSVGMNMVHMEKYEGFCADIAGALCLLISSFSGIPVSTTHTKTTAIMGVGAAKRMSAVNWRAVKEMAVAWIVTFPACAMLGWLTAKIFLIINFGRA